MQYALRSHSFPQIIAAYSNGIHQKLIHSTNMPLLIMYLRTTPQRRSKCCMSLTQPHARVQVCAEGVRWWWNEDARQKAHYPLNTCRVVRHRDATSNQWLLKGENDISIQKTTWRNEIRRSSMESDHGQRLQKLFTTERTSKMVNLNNRECIIQNNCRLTKTDQKKSRDRLRVFDGFDHPPSKHGWWTAGAQ